MRAIYFDTSMPRVLSTLALKKVWGGAVFGPTSPVRYRDLPEPRLLGERWVRLENRLCGICASDLHLVYVDVDPKVHPAALPGNQRMYLGHEVVSEVTEAGPGCRELTAGDRVLMKSRFLGATCHSQELEEACPQCAAGNYALCVNQHLGRAPAGMGGGWGDGYTCHETEVWKLPEELSDDAGSLIEPLACGVRAVLRRPPRAGEKALVLGSGMIGLGVIQALRAAVPEAEVYAAARYPQQIAAAREFGASVMPSRDLYEATSQLTGGTIYTGEFGNRTMLGGFDVVYDCVGTDPTIQDSLRLTRAGGAVVVVGVHLHRIKADLTPTWHQEVDLIGALAHGGEVWEGEALSTFELTARWLGEGRMTADGFITHRFPLERWREAIRTATDKSTGSIKVVFDYR